MDYRIEKASPGDKNAILKVMEVWNMHHVPSPEMEELDLSCFFVARMAGSVVGAAGYKILTATTGKTTLLGIYPELSGREIGKELHIARLEAMYNAGVKQVTTNADRPETIVWYKKHFGYHEVGTLKKRCSFGLEDVDSWTTMEMDLDDFFKNREEKETEIKKYIERNDPAPLAPYPPLIINVCLTGMVPTRMSSPYVPIHTDEIIKDAITVHDAGAQIVHIHVRDKDGLPSQRTVLYEEIITSLHQERPELICCVSTSGRKCSDIEKRAEVLYLSGKAKPDMASLTLGSLNFLTGPSVNSITGIERLALIMKEQGIKPEMEVFDTGMVGLAQYLERHKIISGIKYFNLMLGNINTAPATIGSLATLAESLPADSIWAAAGLGSFQLPMNIAAMIAGGHVRVGIEDSVYFDYEKKIPASNLDLVKRVIRIAGELQRRLATPLEARKLTGLSTL